MKALFTVTEDALSRMGQDLKLMPEANVESKLC